jgi:hypothetical protein
LTDSLSFTGADSTNPAITDYRIGPASWTLGPGSHFCRGFAFEPSEVQPESTIVALHDMPAGAVHALAFYSVPGRYGLAALEGYVTSNPAFPRDAHEEDDFCNAGDARGPIVTVPTGSRRDTLTIDNPHDVDWIQFRVTGIAQFVTVSVASVPPSAADSSDIDLYVLTVPGGGASTSLSESGRSVGFNSSETVTRLLAPGAYYAVVVDYIGRPVRYALCIQAGVACAGFPSPPAADAGRAKGVFPALSPGPRPAVRP